MTTFQLSAVVSVSATTTVEADTLEEAIKVAKAREVVIGGLHTGADPEEQWVVEDADGSPEQIHEG
jgi:hypothetical protein